jgi:hypothetical protein
MQRLNLPTYSFNIKSESGRDLIFDAFRSRWITLTPEEWVRQNFAEYLVMDLEYPRSLLLLEQTITLNNLTRRCDIVAYNRSGVPVLLVECKSPDIVLSQKVFDQVARYNLVLGVKLLIVTNGLDHFCIQADPDAQKFSFLQEIPPYSAICDQSL